MPSWNIHTAHVERLFACYELGELGIADDNAFLFGNYVPDIYLGFMVHDASYRIDYCLTHFAEPNTIPLPVADRFWDDCIFRRRTSSPVGLSLALGVWAHLYADRHYNGRFREFLLTHDAPSGDELRKGKQGDFALFGGSLKISRRVRVTPELLQAAKDFRSYSILQADVNRAVDVANGIVESNGGAARQGEYRLLSYEWMAETFDTCDERMGEWLRVWSALEAEGRRPSAADMHAACSLPPAFTLPDLT